MLPSLVKTELAAGVKDTRASNSIEPEVVAGEIVKALKKPKLAVYAPASMGPITKVTGLHPARARQQDHDRVRLGSSAARLAVSAGRRRPTRRASQRSGAGRADEGRTAPDVAVAGLDRVRAVR